MNQSLHEALRRIFFIVIAALLFSFLGGLWLARIMVSPIRVLVKGMEKVSKGRLDPISFPKRNDELGWMGEEVNNTIHKLKQLDEMKRDFVASVTHELRSPLAGIDSLVDSLIDGTVGTPSGEQRNLLITIQNNASRLTRLIDDLLTTAKIEAGRMEIRPSHFNLSEVIRDVARLYDAEAKKRGLHFETILPGKDVRVFADPDKVAQILNNLLSNAFKFTKDGSVKVSVKPNHQQVAVFVMDSGVGIPPHERENLFNKFFRSRSLPKNMKGTGLGLFITKALVEAQSGTISVADNNGQGTKFTVTLPPTPPPQTDSQSL